MVPSSGSTTSRSLLVLPTRSPEWNHRRRTRPRWAAGVPLARHPGLGPAVYYLADLALRYFVHPFRRHPAAMVGDRLAHRADWRTASALAAPSFTGDSSVGRTPRRPAAGKSGHGLQQGHRVAGARTPRRWCSRPVPVWRRDGASTFHWAGTQEQRVTASASINGRAWSALRTARGHDHRCVFEHHAGNQPPLRRFEQRHMDHPRFRRLRGSRLGCGSR